MTNLKTIIVDKDSGGKEHLLGTIASFFPELILNAEISSLEQTKELIDELKPQLAFVDLDSTENFGFHFLQTLRKITFEIIFISKHASKAIEAFKFSPIDFVLKPIDLKYMKSAIQKTRRRIIEKENAASFQKEKSIRNPDNFLRISNTRGLAYIKLDEIIRFEADGVYTKIFLLSGKTILSSTNLGKYEKIIQHKSLTIPNRFFRIHHKHFINLMHINQFLKVRNSIRLVDETEIRIAQRRLSGFKKRMLG